MVWVILLGAAGGGLTILGPWYYGLIQPSWRPPDWLFGPVWTIIFILAAYAGVRSWTRAVSAPEKRMVLGLFVFNSLLNMLWSLLFFTLQRPDWALMEIPLLWLSIAMLVVGLYRLDGRSSLLLLPYLVWVTFAGVLNYHIVVLNAPFG